MLVAFALAIGTLVVLRAHRPAVARRTCLIVSTGDGRDRSACADCTIPAATSCTRCPCRPARRLAHRLIVLVPALALALMRRCDGWRRRCSRRCRRRPGGGHWRRSARSGSPPARSLTRRLGTRAVDAVVSAMLVWLGGRHVVRTARRAARRCHAVVALAGGGRVGRGRWSTVVATTRGVEA